MKKITWGPVTQLAFLPRLFPINCYLVEEEDGVTLIDAGMPFVAKGMLEAIADIGKPLNRILLTHAHGDHIGAAKLVKAKHPAARIGISSRDARLLQGDLSLLPGEAQSPVKGDVPKKPPFAPDFLIEDGERIGSLVAVATPGHTPGHMAFWEPASRTLIAGDAFATRGGIAVSGRMKLSFPFPALATWHLPTSIRSAEKLAAMNPAWLAVGHGPAIGSPSDAMNEAIRDAQAVAGKKALG